MQLSDFLCAFLINVIIRAPRAMKSSPLSTLKQQNWSIFYGKMWQIFLILWQNVHIFMAKFGISNGNFPRCQISAALQKLVQNT